MINILLLFTGFITAFVIVICYECKIRRTEPMNKMHFYVARDKNSLLYLYLGKPKRSDSIFMSCTFGCCIANISDPKEFGLNPDDFKDLKWEDEPVEVFLNLED